MSRWLIVAGALLATMWIGTATVQQMYAARLPEKVPIHWNANWEPDRFVSRENSFMIFYVLPVIDTGIFALLLALPWLSPRHFKIDDFRPTYDYVIALVTSLFVYLHAVILAGQFRGQLPGSWFVGGFFLFLGLIGNVLGKVRKNFWVGIRTPWTLASDLVWEKTHRLAAWMFVGAGIVGFALVLIGVPWLWCMGLIIAAALVPVVYSLVLYKNLERSGRLDVESSV